MNRERREIHEMGIITFAWFVWFAVKRSRSLLSRIKGERLEIAMKDNDKLVTLIRLRDILYSGVRPSLRESGFSADTLQELVKEELIQSRDNRDGDDSDRYVIEKILPAGHSFISAQHALRDRRN